MKTDTLIKIVIIIIAIAFPIAALFGGAQSAFQPTFKCLSLLVAGGVIGGYIMWKNINVGGLTNTFALFVIAVFAILAANL